MQNLAHSTDDRDSELATALAQIVWAALFLEPNQVKEAAPLARVAIGLVDGQAEGRDSG
jgi:hypothetical protein